MMRRLVPLCTFAALLPALGARAQSCSSPDPHSLVCRFLVSRPGPITATVRFPRPLARSDTPIIYLDGRPCGRSGPSLSWLHLGARLLCGTPLAAGVHTLAVRPSPASGRGVSVTISTGARLADLPLEARSMLATPIKGGGSDQ